MDIESSVQVSLSLKSSNTTLSMEHHSKVRHSAGASQAYTPDSDGNFAERPTLPTGVIPDALAYAKAPMRASSTAETSKDPPTQTSLNRLLTASDEFYPRYWGHPLPTQGGSPASPVADPSPQAHPKEQNEEAAPHPGVDPIERATPKRTKEKEEEEEHQNNEKAEEGPLWVRVGRRSAGGGGGGGGGGHGCLGRRPARDRCRVARQIAVRWMARLMQSAATPAPARPGAAAPSATAASNVGETLTLGHGAWGAGRRGGGAKVLDRATDLSATPFSVGNRGPRHGHLRNGTSGAPSLGTDTGSAQGSERSSAQAGPSPSTYEKLELVPGDINNIPSLLHALREIALSCTPLEALSKSSSSRSSSQTKGNKASLGRQGRGKVSQCHCSLPPSPELDACPTEPIASACIEDYEEQWNAVRNHFATVRRLVLNDKELVETLDSTLGVDWRMELSSEPDPDGPATRVEGSNEEVCTENDYPVATPVQSAQNTGKAQQDVHRCGTGAREVVAANDIHVDTADVDGDSSGTLETQGPLNHNPPAPHSRPCFTLSESSTNYSPSRHVAFFISELNAPLGVAQGTDSEQLSTSYYEPSGSKSTVFPITPSEKEPTKGEGGSQYGAKSRHPTTLNSGSTNLLGAASDISKASGNSHSSVAPPSNSSASSPPVKFCLESREDMMRRRSAAPHAFFAAASPPHRNAESSAVSSHSFGGGAGGPGNNTFPSSRTGAPRSLPVSPLLAFNSPALLPQCPYDYLMVLDFEATCEEYMPPGYLYEILEFPVVLVDTKLQRVMAEFHRFVRPRQKPTLSAFCRSLTGISQEDVDAAAPLEEVIAQFERWYRQTIPPNSRTIFATDGPADFREFMYNHSVARQGIRFPTMFYQWIDIKKSFAAFFNCQQGKIKAMLDALHMPFKGRLHNGLDDARNLANIVIGLLQRGCTFCEVPLSRLLPVTPIGRGGPAMDVVSGSLFLPPPAIPMASTITISGSNSNSSFAFQRIEPQSSLDDEDNLKRD